jgi:endothelin-converting enzyme
MVPELSISTVLKAFTTDGYPMPNNRTVIIQDINYYKNLSNIIQTTPRESLHDYFKSRLIATWAGRLHNNFTAPSRAFFNILNGKDPDNIPPRWRICVSEVVRNLGHILSSAFIQHAFSAADKTLGDRIISDIKQIFLKSLEGFDWMTTQVKEAVAKKG